MSFLKLIIYKIANTVSKVRQKTIITNYYRLLLQSASGITNCDSYYKVRRNNVYNILKNTKQLYFDLFVDGKLLFDLSF